jgi:hypothetical protein
VLCINCLIFIISYTYMVYRWLGISKFLFYLWCYL